MKHLISAAIFVLISVGVVRHVSASQYQSGSSEASAVYESCLDEASETAGESEREDNLAYVRACVSDLNQFNAGSNQ